MKKTKKLFVGGVFLTIFFLTLFVFVDQAGAQVRIENPLSYDTIEELIMAIVRFLQAVAITITAIVIVLAGYYFLTSMGDPQKVTKANSMVLYALIGLLIILVAQGIIEVIKRVVQVENGN